MKKLLLIVGMILIFSTPLYATIEFGFFDSAEGEKGYVPRSKREKKFRKTKLDLVMNSGSSSSRSCNSPNGLSSDEEDQSPTARPYNVERFRGAIERRSKGIQTNSRYESFNLSAKPDYIERCIEYGFVGSLFLFSLIGSIYTFATH